MRHVNVAHLDARELVIERYELKYLVPERLLPAIRAAAHATCRLDRYAGADGTYRIRSLYFDTRAHDLYWANAREAASRFKVRARNYPGTTSPVFLEVKNRILDVIVKTRAAVPAASWRRVIDCEGRALAELSKANLRGAFAFANRVHLHHLEPTLLVEYEREAYESEIDSYARLTFDRNIQVQPPLGFNLDADPKRWRDVDHTLRTRTTEPVSILELKFERCPPAWMVSLVSRLELTRLSFSKYCYGLSDELERTPARTAVS